MIRAVGVLVAVLVLVIGIAFSLNGSVQADEPDTAPAGCEGSWNDCWGGGGGWFTPPTTIPQPTATPRSRERATPTPRPSKPTKAPPAPTNVRAKVGRNLTLAGTNDITVSWNDRSGVSHYKVMVKLDRSRSWTTLRGEISHSPITYKKMKCDKTYLYRVVAYGDGKTYKTGASPISATSNEAEVDCAPELPEPNWRFNCPWSSRVDPRNEDDAILLKGTSDGVFHTARSAMYRPILAILTGSIGSDGGKKPTSIIWCAFASIESASTERVDTVLTGGMHHGTAKKLGTIDHSRMRTPSGGKECDNKRECHWVGGTEYIVQGIGSRLYAVGAHKVTSGKNRFTLNTAGGFNPDHSSGAYQAPPRR